MAANPKMIRGQILAVAAVAYPKPVTDRELYFTLDRIESDTGRAKLREYLRYLADAGYVVVEEDFEESLGGDFLRVRLTGKGLQLLRGEREADSFIDERGYVDAVRVAPAIQRQS